MNCRFIHPVFVNFGVCIRYLAGVHFVVPIPVVARFKAWVFRHSLAGIVGSNCGGGKDICLL